MLKDYMKKAFDGINAIAKEYNVSYRLAAYIIALRRIVKATNLRGFY